MARSGKKRRRVASPPPSFVSETPAQSQEDPIQRRPLRQTDNNSDNDQQTSNIESTTPRGTQKEPAKQLSDELKLERAIRLHQNRLSVCYACFNPPRLSDQRDKHGLKKIAFPCKRYVLTLTSLLEIICLPINSLLIIRCGRDINRPTYDNSTANLSKHVATCLKRQHDKTESQKLGAVGVSGTGDINPRDVAQLCAIWCAETARPFAALGEQAHWGILHPTVLKNLLERKAVSQDIGILYTAVQQLLIETLKASLNLIAQVILRPFGSYKKKTQSNSASHKSDSDDNDLDPDDIEDMNEVLDRTREEDEDNDADETQLMGKMVMGGITNIDEVELVTHDIVDFSNEEDDDQYSSQSCKDTLAKFQSIARKLNKSPNSKASFVDICRDKRCLKPHNVERDVRTQWNSTFVQLSGILCCSEAILEWQKDKRHGTCRAHHINQADLGVARDLVSILEIFPDITFQVSTHGAAQISQVVVFIDQITSHLSTAISDQQAVYPPALRNACRAGLQLTNKYYTLTDCSPLYWVAMILHPSFKDEYFKLAQWKPKWIVESIRLTREMWEPHYKPSPHPTTAKQSNHRPRPPPTGVLARLSMAPEAQAGNTSTNPLTMWLAGALTLDDDGQPVNPLKWWIQQGRAGNQHGALLQMALDVLSCPATTVDLKQSFSFGRDIVTIIKAGDICQGFMEGLGVYVGESQVIDWLIAGETFIPHSDRFKFREVEILSVSEIRPPSLQLRVDGGK
ncbi:hypothetical protein MJO29_008289 [Puccinia striiformis f. sp. tritici]|nr:hypothetical protein MJO29_008289 [Puccinia striiformis f. sp. tritici]